MTETTITTVKLVLVCLAYMIVGSVSFGSDVPLQHLMSDGGVWSWVSLCAMALSAGYGLKGVLMVRWGQIHEHSVSHIPWLLLAITQLIYALILAKAHMTGPLLFTLMASGITSATIAVSGVQIQCNYIRNGAPR